MQKEIKLDQLQSPCYECENANGDKKNNQCLKCLRRIQFVDSYRLNMDLLPDEDSSNIRSPIFKICKMENCRFDGEPQPIDNFYERSGICKDCARARNSINFLEKQKSFSIRIILTKDETATWGQDFLKECRKKNKIPKNFIKEIIAEYLEVKANRSPKLF